MLNVTIEDENDNSPAFDRHFYQGSIEKGSGPGTEVRLTNLIKVTDPDLGDAVKMQLLGKKMIWENVLYMNEKCFVQRPWQRNVRPQLKRRTSLSHQESGICGFVERGEE